MSGTEKRTCGTKRSDGQRCKLVAGFGTDHLGWGKCKWHGGNSPALKTAAAREEAAELVRKLTILSPTTIAPEDALLQEVHRSASVVAFLDQEVGGIAHEGMDLITLTENGWRTRAFIDVWTEQRAHLAKVAKMALDAGVAERQVRLAEEQGAIVANILRSIFGDPELGLSAEQKRAAPAIARRHLLSIGTGEAS